MPSSSGSSSSPRRSLDADHATRRLVVIQFPTKQDGQIRQAEGVGPELFPELGRKPVPEESSCTSMAAEAVSSGVRPA